ncbi:MAG: MFS transporter, partial [Pseudomonadota bacterium]
MTSALYRPDMTLKDARALPRWRRPETMLAVMAFGSMLCFSTWMAVAANFVVEVVGFDGSDNGWMHTVREIPGFLAFLAIFIFALIREQTFGLASLFLLGLGSALTAEFPTLQGVLVVTFISSLGFHYYETVAQSLQLQWLPKDKAPKILGWIVSAGAAGALLSYSAIIMTWEAFDLDYRTVYWASGGMTMALAAFCWFAFPQFRSPTVQRKDIVLKKRYWLYYALVFMGGARRQIFVVLAAFMMVELYGFELHHVAGLMLVNHIATMVASPLVGKMIADLGERFALIVEYSGLLTVFLLYAGLYWFEWPWIVAAVLYVADHILFAMAFAQKTYFQKIADPEDQAPTAAVAFTINHIAAVFLPALLGYL